MVIGCPVDDACGEGKNKSTKLHLFLRLQADWLSITTLQNKTKDNHVIISFLF